MEFDSPSALSPCLRTIKQNARLSVKSGAWCVAVFLSLFSNFAANRAYAEDLPDIEARARHVKVLKSSTSKRVYLLEVTLPPGVQLPEPGAEKPAINKLLLLRNGEVNVMALRVLRDINGTQQVIGKRIKQYGDLATLEIDQEFDAIEKISDIIPPPPTPQDKADMAEVDPAPLPFDPDLDAGSSPPPRDPAEDDLAPEKKDEERILGASIEEKIIRFDRHKNWLSLGGGMMQNWPNGFSSGGTYFTTAGVRYGYEVLRRVFLGQDDKHLDTLILEGGLFFYSVSGLNSDATDSYSLNPIVLTGRYTYYFNEDLGLFAYGGFVKNIVMGSSNSSQEQVDNLSMVTPALGVGALYRIGPQWYSRLDVGLDTIAASLMLSF